MHTTSELNGAVALAAPESFGRIGRRHLATVSVPRKALDRGPDQVPSAPPRNEIEAHALRALAANGFAGAALARTGTFAHLSHAALYQGARAHRSSLLARIGAATLQAAGAMARQMLAEWKRRRQTRDTYLALRALDARALRDLGFDRSEILSVAAEVIGDADPTRARSVQALRGFC